MPFFVTGATGRVGRCVVDQLLTAGAEVRALTRHPERAGLPTGVQVVGGDLDRPDELEAAFAGRSARTLREWADDHREAFG